MAAWPRFLRQMKKLLMTPALTVSPPAECDKGLLGPRHCYGIAYYGAYLRGPDANEMHIAFRGDLQ